MVLKDISSLLTKLSNGKDLTVEETEKAFDCCIAEDVEGYFFIALTMGLMAKGVTSDELFGFCKSREKLLPKLEVEINPSEITDNSGTGGDKLKTFNVSTTASFIISAAGIAVAKQSFFAVTGVGGSGDLFRAFGINIIKTSNAKTIKETIESTGFVPYVADFSVPPDRLQAVLNFIRKRDEIGLNYLTPYHLAANVVTPIKMERRVYGIFDNKYSVMLAQLFQKLNYKKGLIICGKDGLDEISNIGKTEIVEFSKNKIDKYIFTPGDFGVKKARYEDIKAISAEQNVIDFLRIIFNKDKGPKRDIVLMNAASSLYLMDKVSNLKDGVELAKQILEGSKAADKLKKLVATIGDLNKLNLLKKKLNL